MREMPNREPLRLAYLAPWVTFGGSDKSTVDLFRAIDKTRVRPYLVTTQRSANELFSSAADHAEEAWNLPDVVRSADMPRWIIEFVSSRHIDCIHMMNSRLAFDLLPTITSVFPRVPVVVQFHVEEQDRSGYVRYVVSRYDNLVARYSVTSHVVAAAVASYGASPAKIEVVYTGVDPSEFDPDRLTPKPATINGGPVGAFRLLYPCRLDDQKDPELMVQVALALRDAASEAVIHVVGDGPRSDHLKRAVAVNRLEGRVVLHGASRQMSWWYANTEAVLLTSRFEGLPFVVAEAMAMRRPVVAAHVGATHELLNADTGYLVQPRDDVGGYVRAIRELEADAARRSRMGTAGRSRVIEVFTVESMARAHESMYEALVGAFG